MSRKDELVEYLCRSENDRLIIIPLLDEMLFLENRMEQLKELPFIQVHPEDPMKQRATPAAKQYKELLQQYANIIKVVSKRDDGKDADEESPLRQWVKRYVNSE